MEATQVKTEEAVQAPGKKEPPKLKVPKKKKKWLKRLIIAVVVLAAIFLIFIRPMMSAGQQFVAGTYLPETAQRQDLRISVSSTGDHHAHRLLQGLRPGQRGDRGGSL